MMQRRFTGFLLITICLLAAGAALGAQPEASGAELPTRIDLSTVRGVPLQHDGRYLPLDTVARSVVNRITGSQTLHGQDAVKVLLAWTFAPDVWQHEPLLRIPNAELRRELALPPQRSTFSYAELSTHVPLRELIQSLSRIGGGRKMNPLESKADDIGDKLGLLQRVFDGQIVRSIPDPRDALAVWRPMVDVRRDDPAQLQEARMAWAAVRESFLADDPASFAAASGDLEAKLGALPAAFRPSEERLDKELLYNGVRPFRLAWKMMIGGTLLAALALAVRRRLVDRLAVIVLIGSFVTVSWGLWLRWTIAERVPASNMYESLLFLGWGTGAFAVASLLFLRHRIVPFTASFMGAISLLLADVLPIDPFIRPIVPVLADTVWMAIHVPIIMVSYSVLAFGVLIAHVQIVAMAAMPDRAEFQRTVDAWHYWFIHVGSILLLVGIATGSMWGASSWGRYWGWDPKEVWSLVALLGYLTILHVRIDREPVQPWARGMAIVMGVALFALLAVLLGPLTPTTVLALAATAAVTVLFVAARGLFATALKSIFAFWMIIMTYVGVNYVLGIGLHSYGFGTGAVVKYMFLLGGIDLGLGVLCSLVYVLRIRSRGPAERIPVVS